MKKLVVIAFPLLFCFGKAQSQLESLMQKFTNEYALQNIELYHLHPVNSDLPKGGTLGALVEDFIHYVKFSENDEIVNRLESLFQSKPDSVLSYLEGNENDLAVILFLHHYFKIKHSKSRITFVLSLRESDFSDLNEIQESLGDEFLNNLWLQNKSYAVNFWLTYLKENGHISD